MSKKLTVPPSMVAAQYHLAEISMDGFSPFGQVIRDLMENFPRKDRSGFFKSELVCIILSATCFFTGHKIADRKKIPFSDVTPGVLLDELKKNAPEGVINEAKFWEIFSQVSKKP